MNIAVLKQLYKDSCIPEMQNSRNRLSGKQWCISPQHIINPSCNPCIFILILTEFWHALKQQKVLTQWETCDDLNVLSLWSPQFYPELHEAQTFFFSWQTQAPDARPWKICICTWFLSGFHKPLCWQLQKGLWAYYMVKIPNWLGHLVAIIWVDTVQREKWLILSNYWCLG